MIADELAPPPPAAPRTPVRIGGQITQPQLVKRVEPEYLPLAVRAHIQGVEPLAGAADDGRHQEAAAIRCSCDDHTEQEHLETRTPPSIDRDDCT